MWSGQDGPTALWILHQHPQPFQASILSSAFVLPVTALWDLAEVHT